eukprot:4613354-Pleurochrysis_carterae.AAC.2
MRRALFWLTLESALNCDFHSTPLSSTAASRTARPPVHVRSVLCSLPSPRWAAFVAGCSWAAAASTAVAVAPVQCIAAATCTQSASAPPAAAASAWACRCASWGESASAASAGESLLR